MKATELMIGDWVLYGDKSVRVLQLSENSKYDWVKPIPLTSEILEKNGWKADERGEYRREPYKLFQTKKGWDFCYGFQGITDIRFVHELQNILRMLGCEGGFKV